MTRTKYTTPGQHRDLAGFRAHLQALDPAFDVDEEVLGADGPLGRPIAVAGRQLGNRFAIHPMEGWDATREGLPSERTLRRWRRFGRSTAKLVWGGEAFAVREDGRATPDQLFRNPDVDVAGALESLRAEVLAGHREMEAETDDLAIGLQLTHSGRYARPRGENAPVLAFHDPALDAATGVSPEHPLATDAELESIAEAFAATAELAWRTGFDFVDLKCCHGYLWNELLGARSRPGPYGGSLAARARLLLTTVDEIRQRCPGLAVAARVSFGDVAPHVPDGETGRGVPHPRWEPGVHDGLGVDSESPDRLDHSEPLELVGLLRERGVRLVSVTLGGPVTSPHLLRPAAQPPVDGYLPPVDPLESVLDHLRAVRACRAAFPDVTLVGAGYSYLMEYLDHVAQHEVRRGHVDLVGLGRMVLTYPELVADVLARRPLDRRRLCRTFSDCTTGPRLGLASGCYPLDPHYRSSPDAARVRAAAQGRRRRRGGAVPPAGRGSEGSEASS